MKIFKASLSKGLFLVTSFLASAQGLAQVPFAAAPENLRYTTKSQEVLTVQEERELSAVATNLEVSGLKPLLENAGEGESVFGVDQIFWDNNSERAIFVKLDVAPEDLSLQDRFLTDQDSFLFHSKTPAGLNYALYFDGFSADLAKSTLDSIQQALNHVPEKSSSSFWRRGLDLLNPCTDAYAQAGSFVQRRQAEESLKKSHQAASPQASSSTKGAPPRAIPVPGQEASEDEVRLSPKATQLAQNVLACTKGLGQAAYDATVGLAIKVAKGAIKLVKGTLWSLAHPIQAWRKTQQRFHDFTAMMKSATQYYAYDVGIGRSSDKLKGIREGLADSKKSGSKNSKKAPNVAPPAKASSAFSKLSDAQKTKFICNIIGKVGIAGAYWFLTPANGIALSHEVSLFMKGSSAASKMESGRTAFMETKYGELNRKYGDKYATLRKDQEAYSRKWARENPKEAAEIARRYQSK